MYDWLENFNFKWAPSDEVINENKLYKIFQLTGSQLWFWFSKNELFDSNLDDTKKDFKMFWPWITVKELTKNSANDLDWGNQKSF